MIKKLLIILSLFIVVCLLSYLMYNHFAYNKKISVYPQVEIMKAPTSSYVGGDPFGAEPTGASQNCGPEHRYKVNVDLKSKEDFVSYLKYNKIKDVSLDNFRRFGYFNYDKADDSFDNQINWTKIIEKTQIKDVGGRKVYTLEYNRISRGKSFVSTCSGYTLKITNDGHISTYGCCGK